MMELQQFRLLDGRILTYVEAGPLTGAILKAITEDD